MPSISMSRKDYAFTGECDTRSEGVEGKDNSTCPPHCVCVPNLAKADALPGDRLDGICMDVAEVRRLCDMNHNATVYITGWGLK